MAFDRDDFKLLASTGDFNLWMYADSAGDGIAACDAAAFFADAADDLNDGDLIYVKANPGTSNGGFLVVTTAADGDAEATQTDSVGDGSGIVEFDVD